MRSLRRTWWLRNACIHLRRFWQRIRDDKVCQNDSVYGGERNSRPRFNLKIFEVRRPLNLNELDEYFTDTGKI
jgi:hypothetical protein